MSLKLGKYLISNKEHGHNLYLGRGTTEDTSLLPKPIVTLPGGVRAPLWKVEPLKNGYYKLALLYWDKPSLETYAVDYKDGVFVIIDPLEPIQSTEWLIKPVKWEDGETLYIIESPSGKVWTVPESKPYTHVIVEGIIVFASGDPGIPYSPGQLFKFTHSE